MTITQQQFQEFSHFGLSRIQSAEEAITLDDLIVEWESNNQRADINAAIREGIADADAGRHRPASEVLSELSDKYGLSNCQELNGE